VNFVVVFTGVNVLPRTFETKQEAKDFKHEHQYGKFATVLPLKGTFTE
jgi:hypothetical protein